MLKLDARELQRLRYQQGQMLRSKDFRDQLAMEAQLRWWHHRALHNTFGVSLCLRVSRVPEKGPLTAVSVAPGLAYDCFGRELILQETREILLPSAPQNETSLTLLIRYKETSKFPKQREIGEGNLLGPCSPFEEEPEFIWKPSSHVEVIDGVPLARVKFDSKLANPNLDNKFAAPISRPLARPHIVSGATIPGNTRWELWSVTGSQGEQSTDIGVQTTIDTSLAGFTEIPCYFAWLQGPLWDRNTGEFFPAPFAHIDLATATQFIFRLWLPPILKFGSRETVNQDFATNFFAFAKTHQLFVCWLGIQPDRP